MTVIVRHLVAVAFNPVAFSTSCSGELKEKSHQL